MCSRYRMFLSVPSNSWQRNANSPLLGILPYEWLTYNVWSCLLWNLVYCNPGHPQDLHSFWNLICQIWLITIEIKFSILKIWDFKGLRSLIILYICNMHLLALKKLLYVDRLKPQKVLRFLPRSYKHVWRQILLIFSFCRNSVGKIE